jgi:hypothetical protein
MRIATDNEFNTWDHICSEGAWSSFEASPDEVNAIHPSPSFREARLAMGFCDSRGVWLRDSSIFIINIVGHVVWAHIICAQPVRWD